MKTIFEQQGVEYRQTGDYMFPNVELTEQTEYQIGDATSPQPAPYHGAGHL